jgi:hypothetical protein
MWLFQPRVVVGRDAAEGGHLVSPQTGRTPAATARHPDVLGLQRRPSSAEELRHLTSVHNRSPSRRLIVLDPSTGVACWP